MKKYLKTPEEVIDALHEGKTVFGCSETCRLYKGIVVGELEDGRYIVNTSIFKQDEPYIEEPEPLKIEVGKFYKTRSGKKARCFYIEKKAAYFTLDNVKEYLMVCPKTGCVWEDKRKDEQDIINSW